MSSDSEQETKKTPKPKKAKKPESSEDDSDTDIRPLYKPRTSSASPKTQTRKPPKPSPDDEIDQLVDKLTRLDLAAPEYRSLYIKITRKDPSLKNELLKPVNAFGAGMSGNQPPRNNPPPANYYPRNNPPPGNQFPRNNLPPGNSFPRNNPSQNNPNTIPLPYNNYNQTSPQPGPSNFQGNQGPPPNPGMGRPNQNRGDFYCFGCGKTGHLVRQCGEIDNYIRQGKITRNMEGKLEWPGGSPIIRRNNETWVDAIQSVKQANMLRVVPEHEGMGEVQQYWGVTREEEDASTDSQEDLGWSPGQIDNCHAYTVKRTDKISKETRKKVQNNPPNVSQRVKKLPKSVEHQGLGRDVAIVEKESNLDSNHAGGSRIIVPTDVHQDKFEDVGDNQFLPMEIDQQVSGNSGNRLGKKPANKFETNIPKIPNPRTRRARDPLEIANDIMAESVTLALQELVQVSPPVRQKLLQCMKARSAVSAPVQEKIGLLGGLASDQGEPWALCSAAALKPQGFLAEKQSGLLYLPTRIGRARLSGIFDTGSEVNLISQNLVDIIGLPWTQSREAQLLLKAVDGKTTRCIGMIPAARLLMTNLELPTSGNLFIKPDLGSDLILGRTWGRGNQANVQEKDDGTYISFRSGNSRYRLNVCPVLAQERESDEPEIDWGAEYGTRVCAARIEDMGSEGSISEEEVQGEDSNRGEIDTQALEERKEDFPYSPQMDYPRTPSPEQRQVVEETDEESGSNEEQREREKFVGSRSLPRSRTPEDPADSDADEEDNGLYMEKDLQDSFVQLVQKGISNEEWNAFALAETQRRERDDRRWAKWSKISTGTCPNTPDHPQEVDDEPPSQPLSPLESSQTLPTQPHKTSTKNRKKQTRPEEHESAITAVRRSRQIRRRKEAHMSEEDQRPIKTYLRHEHQSRKTIRSRGEPITMRRMHAYAA